MDRIQNTPEIIKQLREERFTEKQQILSWIVDAKVRIAKKAETDKRHSAAFYHAYMGLLDRFSKAVQQAVLFERLEDKWFYELSISYRGASLMLIHASDCWIGDCGGVTVTTDQAYTLVNVKGKTLTVEEYADAYGVNVGTVRQWIRRGKIRTAIKAGKEWRIPEMTDMVERGYQSAVYMWFDPLGDLPEEYEFLRKYSTVLINQDTKDRTKFIVTFAAQGVEAKMATYDTKERERLELLLIANPAVVSMGMPEDGLNVSISCVGETSELS